MNVGVPNHPTPACMFFDRSFLGPNWGQSRVCWTLSFGGLRRNDGSRDTLIVMETYLDADLARAHTGDRVGDRKKILCL